MNPSSHDINTKAGLRAAALARRDGLPTAEREPASAAIAKRAIALIEAAGPKTLAAYMPIRSEVDPLPIIAWAFRNGIAVALPAVVDPTTIVFRRYREPDILDAGRFGTLHPSASAEILRPDLVILPMTAFDRRGRRLGHGRGFYDRAMARLAVGGLRPLLVGVAFAVQEVEAIPAEGHDIHMDRVVTENEMIDFRSVK
jgi:5-formyltetrahydrofolate cyclo-ligase